MLSSNMLLPNLILLIDVTFSTATPVFVSIIEGEVLDEAQQRLGIYTPKR
jgi:hypothetical protein